ncbi:NAD(P)H-hydrate dehydratase [Waterburya agarophytonicola K14]|uniref:Bifunctional NAD(P)H-hydrate repair enzyme n=1 Tax=Waterburya agarophytonicola KI4 TaxID=2874699 RepID=A0A964FHF2_9CYAN|nr:NAD(P)H-hydrate dehydratase [Waterburya agarophytonicola]MCC0179022.1 NAD(P)H-hydrate dehydratase [Waterburya agarophytonicola KI4]
MKNIVETIIVSASQMQQIEEQIFAAGMPVSALMEKAARLCSDRIQDLYPQSAFTSVGILVGPGHNGGDALVVARELYLAGYKVKVFRPFFKLKSLTTNHSNYATSLGINFYDEIEPLQKCQLLIDGLFGFGLTRELPPNIVEVVNSINNWSQPVVSIDLPSGIHTDTGEALGGAIKASHTLCLGLWKQAFFQDVALAYLGKSERVDFGILPHQIWSVLTKPAPVKKMDREIALKLLPLPRPSVTHKYSQGHLLLICGSLRYAGAAILTALGARASGVGMLSVAVPESLKTMMVSQIPEALIIECPENKEGAIASLPFSQTNLNQFQVIACGCGITKDAKSIVEKVLSVECPLILDADALNILSEQDVIEVLAQREFPTVLTPHEGEFKRLFPEIVNDTLDRLTRLQTAAQQSNSIILLKGARTAIANETGLTWLIPESTPALARGGSGDVLTGLMGGLIAQTKDKKLLDIVAGAAFWHARSGILAAKERTELGVDATTLAEYIQLAIIST